MSLPSKYRLKRIRFSFYNVPFILFLLINSAIPFPKIDNISHFSQKKSGDFGFLFKSFGTIGGRVALGDIQGDGFKDIVLHKWASEESQLSDGKLVWYQYPKWYQTIVKDSTNFRGDGLVIVDFDNDGDQDIIASKGKVFNSGELLWYENLMIYPFDKWIEHFIDTVDSESEVKDIGVSDIDGDEKIDIVVRSRNLVALYFQEHPDSMIIRKINVRNREGMALNDIDGDGDTDIILNGFFLENPDNTREGLWSEYTIDSLWYSDITIPNGDWPDHSVMVDVSDFNGDGAEDIVYSHSEKEGFSITWYESDDPKGGQKSWLKHDIFVVDYCHTLATEDIDFDGDIDIVAANSKRSENPKVVIFLNDGQGMKWQTVEIDNTSAYKAAVSDIDNDGDFDIVSSLSWEDPPIQIWYNTIDPIILPLDRWERYLVDNSMPERAIFVETGDLDSDSLIDLVAGAWWWKNPGSIKGSWIRQKIGDPLNNVAVLHDFDGDGDLDILGTQGIGSDDNNNFAWARNDGEANFTVLTNINSIGKGDFLQGRVFAEYGESKQVALSWHNGGGGIYVLTVPDDPEELIWEMSTLSTTTLSEDLSVGDIDRDGDLDLLLGTVWLKNEDGNWMEFVLGEVNDLDPDALPDRNELADINGDNRLDAVIGLENGKNILWFESPGDPTKKWHRHVIGKLEGGGFSLDVTDFDMDHDMDVVVGEHRGVVNNRVILFENIENGTSWQEHIIDNDAADIIDHHDGTRAVDIDQDGDLDIVSIGWFNEKIWIYENRSIMSTIIDESKNFTLPDLYLEQNYPNPFNPITTIRFGLNHATTVVLEIFDIQGRKIKTIRNNYKSAGWYEIVFDGSSLASGVYYYRLKTDHFQKVKKMVLIK